jgi:DeoR/GlpR family transcriptional regulator of sugar metabolism
MISIAREVKMSPDEKDQALKAVSQLKPGDLILIKTPNTMYELMRKIYNTPYDHIVVVVD